METVSGVHLWLILMKAHQALMAATTRLVAASGLGDSEFRTLEVLLHKGPLPVNVIGPKVFLTPGSISVAVDRLLKKGHVQRTESPEDRRVRIVDLTPQGRKLITKVFREHEREMEQIAQTLTPAQRLQLAESLKKLGKAALV